MPESAPDSWTNAVASILFFGGIGTWVAILTSWRRNGCVLQYEPRQPVPWGPVAIVLPILLASMAVTEGLSAVFEPPSAALPDTGDASTRIAMGILLQTVLAAGFVLAVAAFSRATASDLGLPASFREFVVDVCIGVLTCLAAVLPVFAILAGLRWIFQIEDVSRHPLVEVVNRSGDGGMLLLASVAAVLAAPVTEELLFRLLLQGWLEKWLGTGRNDSNATEEAAANVASVPMHWAPIAISSVLFAAAHFGYGPEPVPIFILALFLGYVYQRTHRILPCMVAHGMFNSVSMFMLWRLVVNGAQ